MRDCALRRVPVALTRLPIALTRLPVAPFLLLLVAGLGFGLLAPNLGFYWDDWAKILVSRLYGLGAYPAYYAGDRPLSAWTHMLFTPLLGESPLPWQVFTLLLRWLSALGMLWSLNLLWPRARRQNLVAALLFLIYPVFTQQPAGVTFHQQWLQFALFFLSLGAMIRAVVGPGSQTAGKEYSGGLPFRGIPARRG